MDNAQGRLARLKLPHFARRRLLLALLLCLVLAIFVCVYVKNSNRLGSVLRMPANSHLQALSAEDFPAPIENLEADGHVWALRRSASTATLNPAFAEAAQFIQDSARLVSDVPKQPHLRVLAPILFAPDGASPPLFASLPPGYGEALDAVGRPVRWRVPENQLAAYNVPRPAPFQTPEPRPVNPKFAKALAKLAPARNAGDYRQLVEGFAKRYGLNTNLVMAIIHSESNFTPTLVSPRSAMGLMQLLPSTASDEVHRFLYGRRGQVNFEQLSVPEINIRYGTAYLHILNNRYFANVRDRQVREACVIASYNMGPNGFLRLYGPTPELAVEKINSMSSDEFHDDLPRRLPQRETRFYVEKVKRMKQHYAGAQ